MIITGNIWYRIIMEQTVMVGYSDSSKDVGYIQANTTISDAQKEMMEVAERHGCTLALIMAGEVPSPRGRAAG